MNFVTIRCHFGRSNAFMYNPRKHVWTLDAAISKEPPQIANPIFIHILWPPKTVETAFLYLPFV